MIFCPGVHKSGGVCGGVEDGVPNVTVPQVVLYQSRVVAALCQGIATGVPQHVGVNGEGEVCALPISAQQLVKALAREFSALAG